MYIYVYKDTSREVPRYIYVGTHANSRAPLDNKDVSGDRRYGTHVPVLQSGVQYVPEGLARLGYVLVLYVGNVYECGCGCGCECRCVAG
jgi:hypothetical protein